MLYTISYSGWQPDAFRQHVDTLQAILVDVRYTPSSRWIPYWRQPALSRLFGEGYVWVQALGNRAYKDRPRRIEIADLDAGLAQLQQLVAIHTNAVLACGCPDLATCHRLPVADAIEARWRVRVEHLPAPQKGRER